MKLTGLRRMFILNFDGCWLIKVEYVLLPIVFGSPCFAVSLPTLVLLKIFFLVQDGACIIKYRDSKEKYIISRQSEEAAHFSVVSTVICAYSIIKLYYSMTFSLNKASELLKSPSYSRIQGNFQLIHELFVKRTHVGGKINTVYASLLRTVYHHTKKYFILGRRFLIYGKFYCQK